jgi:hypothetical protein
MQFFEKISTCCRVDVERDVALRKIDSDVASIESHSAWVCGATATGPAASLGIWAVGA